MARALTLAYRPKRFSDLVGQEHVRQILKALVRQGEIPPALIFGGSRGTGKTTAARILAAALNCEERREDGDACGECVHCVGVQTTSSLSVIEIDAASSGRVEDVRAIRDVCQYAHEGDWRVVLLDEAHSMTNEAFNALLKIMEEPPPSTVFVLLTTEPDGIMETVRSRSMYFEFKRISEEEIITRLRHVAEVEGISYEDNLLIEIADRVNGGLRDAVMLLDQVSRVGVKDADGFRALFGVRDISVQIMKAAAEANLPCGFDLIDEHFRRVGDAQSMVTDLVRLTRDLMTIKAGGKPRPMSVQAQADREDLAVRLTVAQLMGAVRLLWDLRGRLRNAEDQRESMDLAFALLADKLGAGTEATQPIQKVQVRQRASLAQLRDMCNV